MNRLTQKDEQGNWHLKGVRWEQLRTGSVITEDVREKLYAALWKLMDYEDTDMSPDLIWEMIDQYADKCVELAEERQKHRWIPVEERLPEKRGLYLVTCSGRVKGGEYRTINHYNADGEWTEGRTRSCGDKILAWMPLPEAYRSKELKEGGR